MTVEKVGALRRLRGQRPSQQGVTAVHGRGGTPFGWYVSIQRITWFPDSIGPGDEMSPQREERPPLRPSRRHIRPI
jgi:hypothetical protein